VCALEAGVLSKGGGGGSVYIENGVVEFEKGAVAFDRVGYIYRCLYIGIGICIYIQM